MKSYGISVPCVVDYGSNTSEASFVEIAFILVVYALSFFFSETVLFLSGCAGQFYCQLATFVLKCETRE